MTLTVCAVPVLCHNIAPTHPPLTTGVRKPSSMGVARGEDSENPEFQPVGR